MVCAHKQVDRIKKIHLNCLLRQAAKRNISLKDDTDKNDRYAKTQN